MLQQIYDDLKDKSWSDRFNSLFVYGYLYLKIIWKTISFRVTFLFIINLLLYFFLEWASSYKRFQNIILIVNMILLLGFLPALHVANEIKTNRTHLYYDRNRYIFSVFIISLLTIFLALGIYFLPYFFLIGNSNQDKLKRIVYLFCFVFLYSMLWMTYGDRMEKIYGYISKIPFLPNKTFFDAIFNMVKYVILYTIVCLPIDIYRILKNIVLGNYDIKSLFLISVIVLLIIFVVLYGKKIKQSVLSFNNDLVVLRKEPVFFNKRTLIGRYNDVIIWKPDDDKVLNEQPYLKEEIKKSEYFLKHIKDRPIVQVLQDFFEGKISTVDTIKIYGTMAKEDILHPIKNWLLQPSKDEDIDFEDTFQESYTNQKNLISEHADVAQEHRIHYANFSLSFWFYMIAKTSNFQKEVILFNFADKVQLSIDKQGTKIYIDVDIDKEKSSVRKRAFVIDTFQFQKWNHCVITFDGLGKMNVFINNTLVATNSTLPKVEGNEVIFIGEENGAQGMIQEWYYYSKTLTKNDVQLLYSKVPLLV